MTHASLTLIFCITSNPCASPFDVVVGDIESESSACFSIEFIRPSSPFLTPISFVADNDEEGRIGKQSGAWLPR